jgi:hypothetical protein
VEATMNEESLCLQASLPSFDGGPKVWTTLLSYNPLEEENICDMIYLLPHTLESHTIFHPHKTVISICIGTLYGFKLDFPWGSLWRSVFFL